LGPFGSTSNISITFKDEDQSHTFTPLSSVVEDPNSPSPFVIDKFKMAPNLKVSQDEPSHRIVSKLVGPITIEENDNNPLSGEEYDGWDDSTTDISIRKPKPNSPKLPRKRNPYLDDSD